MKNMQSLRFISQVAILVALAYYPGFGSTFQSGNNVHLSHLHQIDDDFYAAGEKILVDGTVNGDLLGVGSEAVVKGVVGGSANLACRYIDFSGRSHGSLRCFGERMTISGQVGGSLLAFGAEVIVSQGSVIEKDAHISAGAVDIGGIIRGDLDGSAGSIRISGQIEGDVDIVADEIIIAPPAVITGNLVYHSAKAEALELEPGVTIVGETIWEVPETSDDDESDILSEVTYKIASLLAALIFGIIITAFFRPYAEAAFEQGRHRTSVCLAAGVLGLLVLALSVLALALALILSAVGGLMVSGDLAFFGVCLLASSIVMIPISGFVSVSGGIVYYSAPILVAFVVGYQVVRVTKPEAVRLSKTSLLIGLIILSVVNYLPYIGIVLAILIFLTGAGAIILGVKNCRRQMKNMICTPAEPETDQPDLSR